MDTPKISYQKNDGTPAFRDMTPEEIVAIQPKPLINEHVQAVRASLYRSECDPLYIAYMAYREEGNDEAATQMKAQWLSKKKEIRENNPYNE